MKDMFYEVHIIDGNIVSDVDKTGRTIHHFNTDNFYENKIKSRLFFDERVNELFNDDFLDIQDKMLIELYLVETNEDNYSKFFIKNSNGLENNENKQIENSLLNKTTQQVFEQKKLERDKVYSKNSFLDGNY